MTVVTELFLTFLKIGAFSFGGGYAMIPLMKMQVVDIHPWMTSLEFLDILGIEGIIPGPVAINLATLLGQKVAGIQGSLAATFAVVLPSFFIVTIIAKFLDKYRNSDVVNSFFKGLRPITVGLMIAGCITVFSTGVTQLKDFILFAVFFYLMAYRDFHPIATILIAAVIGMVFF